MSTIIENELHTYPSLIALSQERLKEVLNYNSATGIFIWIHSGKVAGSLNTKGYIIISVDCIRYGAHQLAWLYVYGIIPLMLDHKDGIGRHNWIDNLQEANYSNNNRKKYVYNPHGYKGIRFRNGMFQAHIRIDGKITRIGKYTTAKEAGEAYATKARELFGEFENNQD